LPQVWPSMQKNVPAVNERPAAAQPW
jgi:hypothetical protein